MSVTYMSRRDFGVSHMTPTRPDPTRPLYLWLSWHHVVALVTRAFRDDMDAATRWGFA